MSRSRRKPYCWCFGGGKQKPWIQSRKRALRRATKQKLIASKDYEALILPILDEYANPWSSPRDASRPYYWPEGSPQIRRK